MTELDSDDETDGDSADDERLLFGEKREETTLLAGSGLGVTRIDVAAAQVGQFSLLERGTVRDIATDRQTLIVATEGSVAERTEDGLKSLGFDPAEAVGIDDSYVYAADSQRVARLNRATLAEATADDWETVGSVDKPRRFAGNLLAGRELVQVGDELDELGLADVRDLAADGSLAATADGLFERHGDGWKQLLDGTGTAVAVLDGRTHAVVDGVLCERDGEAWVERELPGGAEPHLLAAGETLAVIDTEGTIHVAADPDLSHDGHGGWRSQAIGLRDVTALVTAGKKS